MFLVSANFFGGNDTKKSSKQLISSPWPLIRLQIHIDSVGNLTKKFLGPFFPQVLKMVKKILKSRDICVQVDPAQIPSSFFA